MNKDLLSQLIANADEVYADPQMQSSVEFQQAVTRAEEFLLASIYAGSRRRALMTTGHADGFDYKLEGLVDSIEASHNGDWQPLENLLIELKNENVNIAEAVIDPVLDSHRMADSKKDWQTVPGGLQAYVERSLAFDAHEAARAQEKSTAPGILVSLTRQGMEVIKSTLQGFSMQPAMASATRLQGTTDTSRHSLSQSVAGMQLQYDLIREDEDHLTMEIRSSLPLTGHVRLSVLTDDSTRILDTIYLDSVERFSFQNLERGAYQLALPGGESSICLIQ